MTDTHLQVPHLTTAFKGPLHQLEQHLLNHAVRIESWFREQWQTAPTLFYSSVDLRNAGFKLAPVDTNLFPAGFNNLSDDSLSLSIQAVQATMSLICPTASQILLIPENHTRNLFYFEHLARLQEILSKAGFYVRIGSLLDEIKTAKEITLPSGRKITLEPLTRKADRIYINDFSPCVILLNNDLASGVPEILQNLAQKIIPPLTIGWETRSKSKHFNHYKEVSDLFAAHIQIDPWLIAPLFRHCGEVNFMTGAGEECLMVHTEALLQDIAEKYKQYGVEHPPFVVVKADAGTYGMAVMTVRNPEEIRQLNRKQRISMSAAKGGRSVSKVIIQEGVYSFETWGEQQSVAEPVVYMLGRHVVGGFYRVHSGKGVDENLNSPGMNFEPLAFAEACNNPCYPKEACTNRFYAYGVIARLALLAAAREL
jgi:glutamate--cysteine ligase